MKQVLEDFDKKYSFGKKEKGIHSRLHELVKEICDYYGSYADFGKFLGTGVRVGYDGMKKRFEYAKGRGIKDPKYLLASMRKDGIQRN